MTEVRKRRGCRIPTCCLVVLLLAAIVTAGFVFFVAGGKMRVAALLDDIRDKGELVRTSELGLADVPDSENAFPVYKRAAAMVVQDWSAFNRVREATKNTSHAHPRDWRRADIDALRREVERNTGAIRLARQAAQMPRYRSVMDWRAPSGNLPSIWWGQLSPYLTYKTRVDLADGRIEEAIEMCVDRRHMAKQIDSEPSLLCLQIAETQSGIFLSEMEHVIRVADKPRDFARIDILLEEPRPDHDLRDKLVYYQAEHIQKYEDVRTGQRSVADALGSSSKSVLTKAPIPGWALYHDEAAYLEIMTGYVAAADKPYCDAVNDLADLDRRVLDLTWYCPLARAGLMPLGAPYLADVCAHAARMRMRSDVLRTAAAIKLYRAMHDKYPNTLSDLVPAILPCLPVDEFSGNPLRYAKHGRGFVVYSIGQDLIDDGGVDTGKYASGDIVYAEK